MRRLRLRDVKGLVQGPRTELRWEPSGLQPRCRWTQECSAGQGRGGAGVRWGSASGASCWAWCRCQQTLPASLGQKLPEDRTASGQRAARWPGPALPSRWPHRGARAASSAGARVVLGQGGGGIVTSQPWAWDVYTLVTCNVTALRGGQAVPRHRVGNWAREGSLVPGATQQTGSRCG